jgi:hypothetical protein
MYGNLLLLGERFTSALEEMVRGYTDLEQGGPPHPRPGFPHHDGLNQCHLSPGFALKVTSERSESRTRFAFCRRSIDQLSGEVSIKTRVTPALPDCSTRSEVRRRRFFGLFGSQAPQPSAGRGAPADEPQHRYFAGEAPWALARTDPAKQATVLCVTAEVRGWRSNGRGNLFAEGQQVGRHPSQALGQTPVVALLCQTSAYPRFAAPNTAPQAFDDSGHVAQATSFAIKQTVQL